ncbi:hypothetical protein ED733_005579 [Metarhizium rileyi]|uniref:endo-1,3(4)-beta-glucanase n=1 Tax=Metarhizium rileyi (strain RCEF 4871) TaxID=1649241 RepID=A0A5C6GIZ1_METRR|nr:hypothetical protein ED733_005579 [Metarhizium rileyi]
MRVSCRIAAFASTVILSAGVTHANYQLDTTYDTTNFFNDFNFFTGKDPTKGFVEYVDGQTANKEGLAKSSPGGIFMGVDHQTKNPPNGRKSVRVTSKKSFTHGLFVADIAHMPGNICGTWPAFWMLGPGWPESGEIDILEGVNAQTQNVITLHTKPGCRMSNEGTIPSTQFASPDCGASGASAGCGQRTSDTQAYGDGFNSMGGGVYATEWTSDHIAVWFFSRSRIPQDITSQNPNPSGWGPPTARFVGGSSCIIDHYFKNHQIVFDTTFCGDWAGAPQVWNSDPKCSALAPTCKDYVAGNPDQFANAFWMVKSVKVYQQRSGNGQPSAPPAVQPQPAQVQPSTGTQPSKPAAQLPPPSRQGKSWDGQVWNGGGWHAKREDGAFAKRFTA